MGHVGGQGRWHSAALLRSLKALGSTTDKDNSMFFQKQRLAEVITVAQAIIQFKVETYDIYQPETFFLSKTKRKIIAIVQVTFLPPVPRPSVKSYSFRERKQIGCSEEQPLGFYQPYLYFQLS